MPMSQGPALGSTDDDASLSIATCDANERGLLTAQSVAVMAAMLGRVRGYLGLVARRVLVSEVMRSDE